MKHIKLLLLFLTHSSIFFSFGYGNNSDNPYGLIPAQSTVSFFGTFFPDENKTTFHDPPPSRREQLFGDPKPIIIIDGRSPAQNNIPYSPPPKSEPSHERFQEFSAFDFHDHFGVNEDSSVEKCIKVFEKYEM